MGNKNDQKKDIENKIINEEKLNDIKQINLIETVKSQKNVEEIFSSLNQILTLKLIKYKKNIKIYQKLILKTINKRVK